MGDSRYIIRNYRASDFNSFVQLKSEAQSLTAEGGWLSPQAVSENLERPNYSPEQGLFVVEADENIVGYMDMAPEIAIGRVILDCWVDPEHRRRGLATRLLKSATHRAQGLGAKLAHVNIAEDNVVARGVLSKLGFECVRKFLELRLDMTKVRWSCVDKATLGCRHLQCGEEDKLTQIQNRSFSGTWGYNPNTEEEVRYAISMSNCAREGILLAYERDRPIGYCWTRMESEEKSATDESKGRIFMLGVDPDYRGRGVGRRVVLAGLAYLRSKGLRFAELTVDSENKPACALYRSVGFEICSTSSWYEKVLS